MISPSTDYDAIVIGGGPAGATCANVLSQHNHSVLVLERAEFPRFHVGESMLTYGSALFERLGFGEDLRNDSFPIKTGAEFCEGDRHERHRVDFADQGSGRVLTTYQVERADFDTILLERAAQSGAEVICGARVDRLDIDNGRVVGVGFTHHGSHHTVRAERVLDASGRAGVISHQHFKSRTVSEKLRMIAVFKHFGPVDEADNPGVTGDIVIGNHRDGWVWAIPIRPDKLSVGAVTSPQIIQRARRAEDVFDDHVQRIPRIHQRIANASALTDLKTEKNFSYYTEVLAGPGFFVLGDAGCFVDPIFSAGVYLAVASGLKAAELTSQLLDGDLSEQDAISQYTRFYKTGYDSYFRTIYAFYDHELKIGNFLKSTGEWVDGFWVARLLGGDFWSQKNALAIYLRTIERYATFAPFEPLYGCPVYPDLDASEPDAPMLGAKV